MLASIRELQIALFSLCFCSSLSLSLVSDVYFHPAAVQPEANELSELQALKQQDALPTFVFVLPTRTAEVHSHIGSWHYVVLLKGGYFIMQYPKLDRKSLKMKNQ